MSDKTRIRMESIMLRLLPEEKVMLKEKSSKCGLSMSDYLRDLILFSNPIIINKMNGVDVENLSNELNEIGNRINLIARGANERNGVTESDYLCIKDEYDNLLDAYVTYILEAKNDI